LNDQSLAPTLALDEAEAAFEFYKTGARRDSRDPQFAYVAVQAKSIQTAIDALVRSRDGTPLSKWILNIPPEAGDPGVHAILAEAVLDAGLCGLPRLQLLMASWTAHSLRRWIKNSRSATDR
jgi:hypothetical protein